MFFKKKTTEKTKKPLLYIFFDVDGVLNKESDWHNKVYVDPACVKVLGRIKDTLKQTYAEIRFVITSTWRAGVSKSGNDTKQIASLKEHLESVGIQIYDSTPISTKGRQAEICYYIRRNGVNDYVILDDDKSLFEAPEEINLYLTDYKTGLVDQDVVRIKEVC